MGGSDYSESRSTSETAPLSYNINPAGDRPNRGEIGITRGWIRRVNTTSAHRVTHAAACPREIAFVASAHARRLPCPTPISHNLSKGTRREKINPVRQWAKKSIRSEPKGWKAGREVCWTRRNGIFGVSNTYVRTYVHSLSLSFSLSLSAVKICT